MRPITPEDKYRIVYDALMERRKDLENGYGTEVELFEREEIDKILSIIRNILRVFHGEKPSNAIKVDHPYLNVMKERGGYGN
jgi:hypothetical protein